MAQYQPDSGWIYQFDDIVIEPRAHRLERAGIELSVEPKAYAVLVVLLHQAGEVVSKDALLDAAWGHRHVTPGVLTRAVSQLRHVLGDCASNPRYIATVHSLGYRFIGEVRRVAAPSAPVEMVPELPFAEAPLAASEEIKPIAVPVRPTRPEPPFVRWLAAALTLAVIVATLAAVSLWGPSQEPSPSPRLSPRPALVMIPFVRASDWRAMRTRHWPHNRRIATTYVADRYDTQARASGYLTPLPEQASASQG